MRWRVILLLLAAAAGVVLAVVVPRVSRFQPEFADPAGALLKRLMPEDDADLSTVAGEVYDQGTTLLRDAILRDRFVDMILHARRVLGPMRDVVTVLGEERFDSRAGQVVRVDLDVAFKKGKSAVSVSYLRGGRDEPWRLLGVSIEIPESVRSEAESGVPTFLPAETPEGLRLIADELFLALSKGRGKEVYAAADQEFRDSISEARFLGSLDSEQKELGAFRRIIAEVNTGQTADKRRVRLYLLVEYDRSKTTATVEFVREGDPEGDGGESPNWRLTSYRLLMPRPLLPARTPAELRPTETAKPPPARP